MTDVTRILSAIEHGDSSAADQLLPLVYEELWKLATQKMSHERPGQTLQATVLVHEAYLRLVDTEKVEVVKLRYFAGLSLDKAAEALGISRATVKRHWAYARAWLYSEVHPEDEQGPG